MEYSSVKKLILPTIFLLGFLVRLWSIYPANIIIGFDQARDLFTASEIIKGDLKIIGPTAGNNPNLHHGVAWFYFLIPPLLLIHNPFWIALWNSLFNLTGAFIVYLIGKEILDKRAATISAFLASVSYSFIQFSGWLSNPSPTIFSVPLFFLGLAKFLKGKRGGLILAAFALGLSIQFELFFIYLIPIALIIFLIYRPKFPTLKNIAFAILAFSLATSTMIATEIKFGFGGVKSIFGSAGQVEGSQRLIYISQFIERFTKMFSDTILPGDVGIATLLAVFTILFLLLKKKWFLLIYLLSPASMLILGFHGAPWFLIGLPPAIALSTGFLLSKIKFPFVLVPILFVVAFINVEATKDAYGKGQPLLKPDESAILSNQIAVMDYTYQKAVDQGFAINTVTNPLYINAVWAWNYDWYEKKYGYLPSWLGGDQLPPYDTLLKATGDEKIFFLIIDKTPRIPQVHKILAREWAAAGPDGPMARREEKGTLIEEKSFPGWEVSMWKTKSE